MRSLNTKLVLSALGILTMFAGPAFAQEPHYHHRHGAVYNTPDPSQRGNIYNMVYNPDDPALTGGGSVGWNELNRTDDNGGN